eukprot:scaffold25508_cov22-Cyclotella_meneghiniana.AAC.2
MGLGQAKFVLAHDQKIGWDKHFDNPDVDRNNYHRQRRRYGGPTKRSRPIKIDNKSSTWCRGMTMRSIFQLCK